MSQTKVPSVFGPNFDALTQGEQKWSHRLITEDGAGTPVKRIAFRVSGACCPNSYEDQFGCKARCVGHEVNEADLAGQERYPLVFKTNNGGWYKTPEDRFDHANEQFPEFIILEEDGNIFGVGQRHDINEQPFIEPADYVESATTE